MRATLLGLLLTAAVPAYALGEEIQAECGTTSADLVTFQRLSSAADPVVEARLVFIGFPDDVQTLATWADELASDLVNYVQAMSRGSRRETC